MPGSMRRGAAGRSGSPRPHRCPRRPAPAGGGGGGERAQSRPKVAAIAPTMARWTGRPIGGSRGVGADEGTSVSPPRESAAPLGLQGGKPRSCASPVRASTTGRSGRWARESVAASEEVTVRIRRRRPRRGRSALRRRRYPLHARSEAGMQTGSDTRATAPMRGPSRRRTSARRSRPSSTIPAADAAQSRAASLLAKSPVTREIATQAPTTARSSRPGRSPRRDPPGTWGRGRTARRSRRPQILRRSIDRPGMSMSPNGAARVACDHDTRRAPLARGEPSELTFFECQRRGMAREGDGQGMHRRAYGHSCWLSGWLAERVHLDRI